VPGYINHGTIRKDPIPTAFSFLFSGVATWMALKYVVHMYYKVQVLFRPAMFNSFPLHRLDVKKM
jgi:hypothetical protein